MGIRFILATGVMLLPVSWSFAQGEQRDSIGAEKMIHLQNVEVVGRQSRSNSGTLDMGMLRLNKDQLFNLPSMTGEPDIVKALAMQSGVSEGVEGFSGLYVRGGSNDQNLILFDGVPLYQISHLGGLFSSFNTEIVRDVTFYKSSFPANYGGRLSSVVDIRTKSPDFDSYHGAASLGLTSGMFHLSGPISKGKTAFDVSLRRSWLDILSAPAIAILNAINASNESDIIGRYAFTDLNAAVEHRFSGTNRLRVNFYWGNDLFKYGSKESNEADMEQSVDKLRWGNMLVSASWAYRYNDRWSSHVTASFVRYKSIYRQEMRERHNLDEGAGVVEEFAEREDQNRMDDMSLAADWLYEKGRKLQLRLGGYLMYHDFLPSYVHYTSVSAENSIDKMLSDYSIHAGEGGAYADVAFSPMSWFGVDAGLRLAAMRIYGHWETSVEPRAVVRIGLLDGLSLKAGYARMGQFVQQVSDSYVNLPTDNWMPMGRLAEPLTSDQLSGGIYYDFDNGVSLSAEGYYKWLDGIAEVTEDYSYGYDKMQNILYGEGKAYGVDLSAAGNFGRLSGSVSYGLLWSNRRVDGINGGKWYPSKFDNRHKVNIVANYKLTNRIELNVSWIFATGNRMTVPLLMYQGFQDTGIPDDIAPNEMLGYENLGLKYFAERNNVRLPAYHRLDIGASFARALKNGRKGVWRVGLYNAYCHMNAMVVKRKEMVEGGFIDYGSSRPWNVTYETFSMFPIVPNVSYTLYF